MIMKTQRNFSLRFTVYAGRLRNLYLLKGQNLKTFKNLVHTRWYKSNSPAVFDSGAMCLLNNKYTTQSPRDLTVSKI